jgi:hypothetical protein
MYHAFLCLWIKLTHKGKIIWARVYSLTDFYHILCKWRCWKLLENFYIGHDWSTVIYAVPYMYLIWIIQKTHGLPLSSSFIIFSLNMFLFHLLKNSYFEWKKYWKFVYSKMEYIFWNMMPWQSHAESIYALSLHEHVLILNAVTEPGVQVLSFNIILTSEFLG